MPETPDSDILADPVARSACPKCGQVVQTADVAPFTPVMCAKCLTTFAAPGRLGPFVLLKCLGKGAMGATYRALEKGLDRLVALKVMRRDLGGDARRAEDFLAEARAVAALEHPNAVRLYSVGQEKGQPYIAMELIRGRAMDREMRPGEPMPEDRVLEIALGVGKALAAAAEAGLVHGDVKPANIMLDQDGTPKLVDFGVARFGGGRAGDEFMGTPYYAAPEQVRREPTDHRTDIYCLGATMFHALTGRPPFPGRDVREVLTARLDAPPPDPRSLVPGLHPRTARVVMRMLAPQPDGRYPTYRELLRDLQQAYFQVTGLHTPEMQAVVARPEIPLAEPVSESRKWLLVAAAVGLLAAAAGAWALWLRGGSSNAAGGGAAAARFADSPTFQPPPRAISRALEVAIRCETPGAEVRYTLDGTEPDGNSLRAGTTVSVPPGATLKARAYCPGYRPSAVTAGTYSRAAGALPDVVALRIEAEKAWQRVAGLDPGQGFGALLEKADTLRRTGEELYARGAGAEARRPLGELLAVCRQIEQREALRAAARAARDDLERMTAEMKGGAPWRKDDQAAGKAFIEGRFEQARRLWEQAAGKVRRATRAQLEQAEKAWQQALAAADPAALKAHAAEGFRRAEQASGKARDARRAGDYPTAARLFRQAADLLAEARRAADRGRVEREKTALVQRANDLLADGWLDEALAAADAALKLKPSSRSAKEVRKKILDRRTLTLDLGLGKKIRLRWIPAGPFTMGSADRSGATLSATPHKVTISRPFYIGIHEVRRGQFSAFIRQEKQYRTLAEQEKWAYRFRGGKWVRATDTQWDRPGFPQDDEHPVTCVAWQDAVRFCRWASGKTGRTVRLPTEAEWEYACRAGAKGRFCYGDDYARLSEYANFADRSLARVTRADATQDDGAEATAKAGKYKPNAWGLYDMHGNVAEWCADLYGPYPAGPVTDPTGPQRGGYRVVRGGSWDRLPTYCRSACRARLPENYRSGAVGFRVVVEVGP